MRQANVVDTQSVSSILLEAASWLEVRGLPMWRDGELSHERVSTEIAHGLYFIAARDSEAAGRLRYQLSDATFWPDAPGDNAAYVHRLAVRRRFADGETSLALLGWAVERTASLGRRYLRWTAKSNALVYDSSTNGLASSTTATAKSGPITLRGTNTRSMMTK